jgi:hypothetical protein
MLRRKSQVRMSCEREERPRGIQSCESLKIYEGLELESLQLRDLGSKLNPIIHTPIFPALVISFLIFLATYPAKN